jgi:molybdopterin-binding protein
MPKTRHPSRPADHTKGRRPKSRSSDSAGAVRRAPADSGDRNAATLGVRETAALLHLHPKRVQILARTGKLPAARVGRKWLFRREAIERLLHAGGAMPEPGMEFEISARNRLMGRITRLTVDGLMAEIHLDIGGQEIVAVITRSSAERLGLRVGGEAFAVIKATEVIMGRAERRP